MTKPATKAKKPAKRPASQKPASQVKGKSEGISLKDVAARLGRDPKSVRSSIRRILGGVQVGKGGRYSWTSWDDRELKKLMADLTKVAE